MASLLVCAVDDHNADPYKDARAIKRGDVLAVCDDLHPWGGASLTDPRFRVLVFPHVPVAEAAVLLSPELPTRMTVVPDPMLQLRGFRLRLDKTGDALLDEWLANAKREKPVFAVTHQPLAAFIEKKAAIPNPNVIG